jgi:hypothetical protein
MDLTLVENAYDFKPVLALFKFSKQKMSCFENLCSVILYLHQIETTNIQFLESNYLIKIQHPSMFTLEGFIRKKKKWIHSTLIWQSDKLDKYCTFLVLKYLSLPRMSKELLDTIFNQNFSNPTSIWELQNCDFIQNFFDVQQEFDFNYGFKELERVGEYAYSQVSTFLIKYQSIQKKIKIIFYLTENIIFDKTDFSKDFSERYKFASQLFNLQLFDDIYTRPWDKFENPFKLNNIQVLNIEINKILEDQSLSMQIRKKYYDIKTTNDNWNFTNFAKPMDKDIQLKLNIFDIQLQKVEQYYFIKQYEILLVYLDFYEIYDLIQSVYSSLSESLITPQMKTFLTEIYTIRKKIQYSPENLKKFLEHI